MRARTVIKVVIQTGASKNEILGMRGDVLQVKVTTPPESGKANEAMLTLLARTLKVAKSRIKILRGHSSREKVLAMDDFSPEDLRSRLRGGQTSGPMAKDEEIL